jgi:hypothetical protein
VGLGLAVFLDATVVRGVLVPAAMAVMGRRNWWRPRVALQRHRPALPQKGAATVPVGVISVRDEKQAVSTPGDHADSATALPLSRAAFALEIAARVDEGSVSVRERDESGAGQIHYSADVKQTVALERPWWPPAA